MKTLEALVNPFGKLESDSPDNIQKPEFEIDTELKKAFDGDTSAVLSPAQINMYIQQIDKKLSTFPEDISLLVQRSYVVGKYNDFVLDFNGRVWSLLLTRTIGARDTPLRARIIGGVGDDFGSYSKNCIFKIEGDVGEDSCHGVENCIVEVQGNVECQFAEFAHDSTFRIGGNARQQLASYSHHSSFEVKGNVSYQAAEGCQYCTFDIGGNAGSLTGQCSHNSIFRIKGAAPAGIGYAADKCEFYFDKVGKSGEPKYERSERSHPGRRSKFITSNWETYWEMRKQLRGSKNKLRFGCWNWFKRKLK